MARLARVVVSGMPHHVTQRGNRRQPTFFREEDSAAYIELMAEHCRDEGVAIWAYCLMPNHVHLIAVLGVRPCFLFLVLGVRPCFLFLGGAGIRSAGVAQGARHGPWCRCTNVADGGLHAPRECGNCRH